jgi:hypothetical protein
MGGGGTREEAMRVQVLGFAWCVVILVGCVCACACVCVREEGGDE